MTAPRDYIAEVQKLAGCCRNPRWLVNGRCQICGDESAEAAPDVSTLWGAMKAANKLVQPNGWAGVVVRDDHAMLTMMDANISAEDAREIVIRGMTTERAAAQAVCRLIIEHREKL